MEEESSALSSSQYNDASNPYDGVDMSEKNGLFVIDFIGNHSFQVSQLNLLQKRSLEPVKDASAKLSARGLAHRSRDQFIKDVQTTTAIISGTLRSGKRAGGKSTKPSPQLFAPYFQRALGFERLNHVDKAIADYTMCIAIDHKCAAAFFNRAGLHQAKGNIDSALEDLNAAINLDPSNTTYRANRSLLFRQKGTYLEAIHETMLCRAIKAQPSIIPDIIEGNDIYLDADSLRNVDVQNDPTVTALQVPKGERTPLGMEPVMDFLKTLKFFTAFSADRTFMLKIAFALELSHYEKGDVIFEEGQPGHHFFMILDGEVSIVKIVKSPEGDVLSVTTLVKLFQGQAFGEAALEGKGIRTAGALATQKTNLISLHAQDYQEIMGQYKYLLRVEVRQLLSTIAVFSSWEPAKIDYLATFAVVKNYGPNYQVLKEGDAVRHMYIVKRGIVKLIKSMDKPQIPSAHFSADAPSDEGVKVETPGLWVLDQNWKDRLAAFDSKKTDHQVDFTVGILASGQVFGELSVLDPDTVSPVSAVTFTAVEVYCFDSDILIATGARFNSACMNALNESMNLHNPPGDKIAYYYRSKYSWEARKNRVLKNLSRTNPKLLPPIQVSEAEKETAAIKPKFK